MPRLVSASEQAHDRASALVVSAIDCELRGKPERVFGRCGNGVGPRNWGVAIYIHFRDDS